MLLKWNTHCKSFIMNTLKKIVKMSINFWYGMSIKKNYMVSNIFMHASQKWFYPWEYASMLSCGVRYPYATGCSGLFSMDYKYASHTYVFEEFFYL